MLRSNKLAALAAFLILSSSAYAQTVSPVGGTGSGTGTVTSVALSFPNNVTCTVSGSPITTSGTLVCTPSGTSGGIPYFSSASALSSSAALTANAPVIGGGAGAAPTVGTRSGNTTTFGTTSGALTNGHAAAFDASGNIVDSGGAPGVGNAVISPTTGNTAGNAVVMSNTTTGITQTSFAPAPAGETVLINGSNPTIAAADWAAFAQYTIIASGRTLTIPATSTLQSNGGGFIVDSNASSVIVAANAADTITWNGATTGTGGTVTLPVGGLWVMSTDGAGKLYISGVSVTGTGSAVRGTAPTITLPNATGLVASTGINASGTPSGSTCLLGNDTWGSCGSGSGVPSIAGTANQINETGSPGATTLSLSSTLVAPGTITVPQNGATSASAVNLTGTIFTGTGTNAFPYLYYNCSGASAPTTLATTGTLFGANYCTGVTANLLDFHINGGGSIFSVNSSGKITTGNSIFLGLGQEVNFGTNSQILGTAGAIQLKNSAGTGSVVVVYGNNTTSFPSLSPDFTTSTQLDVCGGSDTASCTPHALKASVLLTSGFIVSTLPASPGTGAHAYVTDAVACTFLGALTGSGSTFCPVVFNGTAWVGG